MSDALTFDLIIRNALVVRPGKDTVDLLDIGIRDGKITALAPELITGQAVEVVDAEGKLAFPGLVDAPYAHRDL